MINEPSVDALVRKLGTEENPVSRYELCVIVSKRTRQIITQRQATGTQQLPGKQKEILLAWQEVMNGKVTSVKD